MGTEDVMVVVLEPVRMSGIVVTTAVRFLTLGMAPVNVVGTGAEDATAVMIVDVAVVMIVEAMCEDGLGIKVLPGGGFGLTRSEICTAASVEVSTEVVAMDDETLIGDVETMMLTEVVDTGKFSVVMMFSEMMVSTTVVVGFFSVCLFSLSGGVRSRTGVSSKLRGPFGAR